MSNIGPAKELNALFAATDKANPKVEDLAKLRELLTKLPLLSAHAGDLAQQVERQIIEHALPTKKGAALSVEKYCEYQRNELGFQTATPLERLLIENVVISWLHLYVTQNRFESAMQDNLTFAQAEYWEKKLSIHQRRYLRSLETLARIRKLNINVQINIGDKQVITG